MTDKELRQAVTRGFANPQHLDQLLRRTDLPADRQKHVRTNLSAAITSGKINSSELQRYISQLNKAKTLNQFDQVLAELRHVNRLILNGAVAENSPIFTGAKQGRKYDLGGTYVKIDPMYEADALYLGTDGLVHLDEVKNTANALRNKLSKKPKQIKRMQGWRKRVPAKREIRIVIMTEAGWTDLLASKGQNRPAWQTLIRLNIPLTIGEHRLTVPQMQKLWDGVMNKALSLAMFPPKKDFYDMIPTLEDVKKAGISWE